MAAQAGLILPWSQTPKTGFLVIEAQFANISHTGINMPVIMTCVLKLNTSLSNQNTILYRNNPKLSGRKVEVNCVDPDEQSDQALHCLPFHLHFWMHYSLVKPHCSNFRIITAIFSGCMNF